MRDTLNDVCERAEAKAGSRFALVGAIVHRAHQLANGYPPLVTGVAIDKHATTALREIAAGAVEIGASGPAAVERDEQRAA